MSRLRMKKMGKQRDVVRRNCADSGRHRGQRQIGGHLEILAARPSGLSSCA